MRKILARPITPEEAEVLKQALNRGALLAISESLLATVPTLQVTGICECGCRSIFFAPESKKDHRLADTIGRTTDGKQIDVMVWGAGGQITALDLVDHHLTRALPTAESIGKYAE